MAPVDVRSLEVRTTGDGSRTLFDPVRNEPYHSLHGAAAESRHVFLDAGSRTVRRDPLRVLEVGLGTGLNLLLTMSDSAERGIALRYVAIEPHRLPNDVLLALGHADLEPDPQRRSDFNGLMESPYGAERVAGKTSLMIHPSLSDAPTGPFDVVYFDAFAPNVQPDLWTSAVFADILERMVPGGVLVTYCAKGSVRRAMQAAGFRVERLRGPIGKWHMVRATRPS